MAPKQFKLLLFKVQLYFILIFSVALLQIKYSQCEFYHFGFENYSCESLTFYSGLQVSSEEGDWSPWSPAYEVCKQTLSCAQPVVNDFLPTKAGPSSALCSILGTVKFHSFLTEEEQTLLVVLFKGPSTLPLNAFGWVSSTGFAGHSG